MSEAVMASPGVSNSTACSADVPKTSSLKTIVVWIVLLTPFVLTAIYIARFGVNVPFLDEWLMPYVFRMARAGTHGFGELFWPPNNEHRIVVPKIIWTGLGFLSNYNVKLNMFVSLGCILAAYIGIAALARRFGQQNLTWRRVAVLTSGVVMFSLVNYDTWLMGFQFSYILALVLTLGAILALVLPPWRSWVRLTVALLCCFLATFSSGQGLSSWLVILPCVFFAFERSRRLWVCAVVIAGLLLTIVLYRIDYHPPTIWASDRGFVLKHPIQAMLFAFALLGAPFCQNPGMNAAKIAPWIGGFLCLGFAVLTIIAGRQRRLAEVAGWLAIGLIGIGAAGLTCVGRGAWGVPLAATTSRYMISAVWLPIAFIHMFGLLFDSTFGRWAGFVLAAAMIFLNVSAYRSTWVAGEELRLARADAALFLEVEPYIDKKTDRDKRSVLFPLFPVPGYMSALRVPAEMMGEDGFRKIEQRATFEENSACYGCVQFSETKLAANAMTNGADFLAKGWAALPNGTLPKIVLISVGDERIFIAGAVVGRVEGRGSAVAGKELAAGQDGWQTIVSREFVPPGNVELKAWVYDSAHSKFLRLTNCAAAK
jgi:hypothetical protein